MSQFPLTNEQLQAQAPALFTEEPHFDVSDKYHFIPTIDVIEEIRAKSWYPVSVDVASVRDADKEGYQQHLVRFRHFDDLLHPQENVVELLLFNSHDRSKSFVIAAGIYRFVCSNGLVIADSVFESYKIKHLGDRENDVAHAVANITAIKPKLMQKVHTLEAIKLSEPEKASFAKSSIALRFEPHLQIDYQDLLVPHRDEDTKDDLYTVMNVIQENLLRGNISGVNKESGRRFTSKEITSITKDVEVNQGLWDIAERIAFIKEPTIAQAA
ncbi:DUF945 domain-containing protein [Sulfurimonas sp. SWIR-19]|uniref:DUF932 domain-containing protein n=1 Tax=Sulfurimonas sp. SWIR-19 TaxID=2878390 RepID=UPI001CF28E4D|nr:DUF932 domain-containing protein [Sulfurimonas sp. SWIR-19]UCN00133.1 DUF945 domain-containing protein [Sulfurimonas sp. SWIR-19]